MKTSKHLIFNTDVPHSLSFFLLLGCFGPFAQLKPYLNIDSIPNAYFVLQNVSGNNPSLDGGGGEMTTIKS